MQMSLGLFIFSLPTVVFQGLEHKRDVRHAWNERVGAGDAVQFVGPGTETISLKGVTAHGITHARLSFSILNKMMQSGKDFPLIDGLGNVYGNYVIQSLDISKSNFAKFGQARNHEFTIDLRRANNPGAPIRNAVLDAAQNLLKDPLRRFTDRLSIASLKKKIPIKLPGIKL
jgi:uncharacterized protein